MSKLINSSDKIIIGARFIEVGNSYKKLNDSLLRLKAKGQDGKQGEKGDTGEKGDKGDSYSLFILSSNGSVFRTEDVDTTLSCEVFQNDSDITESIESCKFNWKRNTGHTTEDERWNTSSKAMAHKSVEITTEDCIGRTVFSCEVEL